ncbi:protein argonaute 2-like [Solanum dulcamara]|uniref:protein argonaute 2-like n=1 Tax=Solanum dulcamara TaxID=45834 RepID=UPI00248650DB|nr:protein argonaute 2-like [Solanum dulcamara]
MDRGKYQRGGGYRGRGRGRGYYEQGQGQGRGEPQMGSSSCNQPPFQSPQQWGNQPRPLDPDNQNYPVSQSPGRGGTLVSQPGRGTASPRPQQQQGTDDPSTAWPTLAKAAQQQGSDVASTAWPALPQKKSSSVPSTVWSRPPLQHGSGGGVGTSLQQHGGGNEQQQVSSGGVGTVSARPSLPQQPQKQGSGGGVSNVWLRPPSLLHGGGNKQKQVSSGGVGTVSARPPPLQQPRKQDVPVLLGTLNTTDPESSENKRVPKPRPDAGNKSGQSIRLFANHFHVTFNPETIIMHYDVDVQEKVDGNRTGKTVTDKSDLRRIREKLCKDMPEEFPIDKTAYDGMKSIFSAVPLPNKCFTVNCSDDGRSYDFTIKFATELNLGNLNEYLGGNFLGNPSNILQGMELVMKENPKRCRISVGRCFYSNVPYEDFGLGVAAHTGFQQSLKPTSEGLALCLDYSVLALPNPIPVVKFLELFFGVPLKEIFRSKRQAATDVLTGLKVRVNHRRNKQKFVIKTLTRDKTSELTFHFEDTEGHKRKVHLVDYFREKYQVEIELEDIPSLDIGKGKKKNYVPMEFCELVREQRFPTDRLDMNTSRVLRKKSLPDPPERRETIRNMVLAQDGPCGAITRNFEIEVDDDMISITGRILPVPVLKIGGQRPLYINNKEKCQWNLVGKYVAEGKALQRWALIDFTPSRSNLSLQVDQFVNGLIDRCRNLGMKSEGPVVIRSSGMNVLSDVDKVEELLKDVVDEARQKNKGKLQMIVCVMESKHNGYKYLKWVSETKIGIVTQCCLSSNANKRQDQFFSNLCMKINAKLGGSNMELMESLPNFTSVDNVMFIGADVNHPGARNDDKCPSIAAVVATINWPAANRYAARVRPQDHRTEKILNFGQMCKDLVDTYARLNSVKPNRIVVFRDGVSESQFDMVLNQELSDLANTIYESHYRPAITLVVAQKRHHTRLFPAVGSGNVLPGTVVDTKIVHPSDFDFYLCSHYGQLGTSKPTHYHVLWDENGFTSDSLQTLIYHMCFTFARCTKPVSLVPPVYYADLVAYRGRMFQEVLMEMNSPRSTTSSNAASSSSSSSRASFEQKFYDLHSDLRNIMFFV